MNIQLLQLLPEDLLNVIYEYLTTSTLAWLNKTNYIEHHIKIRKLIPNKMYDNYIRSTLRNDDSFVFQYIILENYNYWTNMKQFHYKNKKYADYLHFLQDLSIHHNSTNCKNIIVEYINKTGLGKNQHKKKRTKNIRWKI